MNPEYTPLIVEPIRYKLWRGRPLDMNEKELIDQALEKQVAKKPIHANGNYYCPTCKDTWLLWDDAIPNEYDNFCRYCGQKIDWSEE